MPRSTKVELFYSGRGLKLRKYNHLGEKGEKLGKRNVAVDGWIGGEEEKVGRKKKERRRRKGWERRKEWEEEKAEESRR